MGPRPDDCSGYSPRPPFFAKLIDQIGKRPFGHVIDQLRRRYAGGLIHPHIQRPIGQERKTSLRRGELIPADSKIGQQPMRPLHTRFGHGLRELAECSVMVTDALAPLARILARHGQGQFVAVVRDRQARREARGDLPRMSAETRGSVDVDTVRPDRQVFQRFRGHDRIMFHTPSLLLSQVQTSRFRFQDIGLG